MRCRHDAALPPIPPTARSWPSRDPRVARGGRAIPGHRSPPSSTCGRNPPRSAPATVGSAIDRSQRLVVAEAARLPACDDRPQHPHQKSRIMAVAPAGSAGESRRAPDQHIGRREIGLRRRRLPVERPARLIPSQSPQRKLSRLPASPTGAPKYRRPPAQRRTGLPAAEQAQQRCEEQPRRHQRGGRVARQSQHLRASHPPIPDRLARLDRHARKDPVEPERTSAHPAINPGRRPRRRR